LHISGPETELFFQRNRGWELGAQKVKILHFHSATLCAYTECRKFIPIGAFLKSPGPPLRKGGPGGILDRYIPSIRNTFMTTAIDAGAEAFPVTGQTTFFTALN
jgi:hypothetical protein